MLSTPLDRLGEVWQDVWKNGGYDLDELSEAVARLSARISVQKELERTASILRDSSKVRQLVKRLKAFIKFVVETTTTDRKERQTRLRKMDPNALIFCGLTYTNGDISDMSAMRFGCLVEHADEFVQLRDTKTLLSLKEIWRVTLSEDYDPEDEELLVSLQKCTFHIIA